jgi:hypothetical protein
MNEHTLQVIQQNINASEEKYRVMGTIDSNLSSDN